MSCYHPIQVYYREGEKISFKRPKNYKVGDYKKITIGCGKCVGCRLDHARSWVARLLMEYKTNYDCYFLTLTYDNEHLKSLSLNIKDFQLFIKRLRKKFDFLKIKYFACGEYGSTTFRPHFHAVIFGVDFLNEIFEAKKYDSLGHYKSQLLNDIWSNGFVVFAKATPENIGYTARYTLKKINSGDKTKFGINNEKLLCSRGLGFDYFLENYDDMLKFDGFYYDGQKYNLPRYFIKKLEELDPEEKSRLKKQREHLSRITVAQYSIYDLKELEALKIAQIKSLSRGKV